MRRGKQLSKSEGILLALLFLLVSTPVERADRCRESFSALFRPSFTLLAAIKRSVTHPLAEKTPHPYRSLKKGSLLLKERIEQLELENLLLKNSLADQEVGSTSSSTHPIALPAKILYRTPSKWNETFWICLGERDNRKLGERVIVKNSPVLIGGALVGTVDYVGKKQSRVKLITGSSFFPAVRSVRGSLQNLPLLESLESLSDALKVREELLESEEEQALVESSIQLLRERLNRGEETLFLAKGELEGSENPLWRRNSSILTGVGFNYEFADDRGPARDLRSGKAVGVSQMGPISILEEGDLLVTSGLDGLFPEGIPVAQVIEVKPLKEGGYYYNIRARVAARSIDTASHVVVIPPAGDLLDEESLELE